MAQKQLENKAPSTPQTVSSKPSNKLAIGALAIAVASTGFFQYRTELLSQGNSALNQHMTLLTEQNQQLQTQAGEQKALLKEYQASFENMQAHLNFMGRTLDQIPGAKVDDWKLAEVEYLLRLANQRIILQQELSGASALLDAANQILAQLDDPSLFVIRKQIAKEMLALGKFQQIDRQGIYAQLQAIKQAVPDAIKLPNEFKASETKTVEAINEITGEADTNWVDTVKGQFLSLVRIRHNEQAFDANLTDEQYQLLEHSLLLMLEQAQWALLKSDQSLFDASLNNAANWIETKLRHGNALTLKADIKKIIGTEIKQGNPDISKSLQLLRQAQVNRTYAPSPIKPSIQPKEKTEPAKQEPKPETKAAPKAQKPAVKQEQA